MACVLNSGRSKKVINNGEHSEEPQMFIAMRLAKTEWPHLVKVLTSPNSLRSWTARNWRTACCFEAEGWSRGMSATWMSKEEMTVSQMLWLSEQTLLSQAARLTTRSLPKRYALCRETMIMSTCS